MSYQEITITRKKLYEQVWTTPMSKLAKEYHISGNGLKKICKKLNVPFPGVGYWQRKQFGNEPPQPPLPPLKNGPDRVTRQIRVDDTDKEEFVVPEAKTLLDQERNTGKKIVVAASLRSPHPLVRHTREILEKKKIDEYGLLWARRGCLDVKVSPKSLRRAMLIMDALVKALALRGIPVVADTESLSTHIVLFDEKVKFGIREVVNRTEPPKDKKSYSWDYHKYEYTPTGRLSLMIKEWCHDIRKTWNDGKKQRIENCLNDFLVGLISCASYEKARTLEREREERLRQERQRI